MSAVDQGIWGDKLEEAVAIDVLRDGDLIIIVRKWSGESSIIQCYTGKI